MFLWNAFSLISSWDHCQRFLSSRISDTPQAGFVEWPEFRLCWMKLCSTDNHHTTMLLYYNYITTMLQLFSHILWLSYIPYIKNITPSTNDLFCLRVIYPKKIILSYLNVNSIRKELDDLKALLRQSVDILCISETNLGQSFPTAQFAIEAFKKSYRLDVTVNRGSILFFVRRSLSSKLIGLYKFPEEIQCIPIELNNSNDKLALRSIHRPPSQNIKSSS